MGFLAFRATSNMTCENRRSRVVALPGLANFGVRVG